MQPKNINALVLYVLNLENTATFYETLGWQVVRKPNVISIQLGSFTIEAVLGPTEEGMVGSSNDLDQQQIKGCGMFILVEVDNVDSYYDLTLTKNVKASTVPKTWSWGRREFVVRDPDGYKLVFYQKV